MFATTPVGWVAGTVAVVSIWQGSEQVLTGSAELVYDEEFRTPTELLLDLGTEDQQTTDNIIFYGNVLLTVVDIGNAVRLWRAGRAAARNVGLRVGSGTQTAPAHFVRELKHGEKIADLIAEGKALTWVTEAEHAILSVVQNGKVSRVVVSGGRAVSTSSKTGKAFLP